MKRPASECSRSKVASIFADLLDAMQDFAGAVQRMVDAASAPDVAIIPEQIDVATASPDFATASRDRKQMDILYSVTRRPSGEPTLRFQEGLNAFSAIVAGNQCDYRVIVHGCP